MRVPPVEDTAYKSPLDTLCTPAQVVDGVHNVHILKTPLLYLRIFSLQSNNMNANTRREVYKRLARTSPRSVYRAATVNRAARNVQSHLNALKRVIHRRQIRRRLHRSPAYRNTVNNIRNQLRVPQTLRRYGNIK